jgi:hypothetical protein
MNRKAIIPLSLVALAVAPGIAFACKQPPKLPPPPPPVEQPPVVPPAPPPVVTLPPPVVPPTGISERQSCSVLRANGAGPKWLLRYGCAKPKPKPLTCRELRARGAGRKSLLARGCVLPPRPGVVAVTG